MILVNTTFAVDQSILDDFFLWVKETFIPEAEKTVNASGFLLTRIIPHQPLTSDPRQEETTYACQFRVASMEQAEAWTNGHSFELLRVCAERWGHRLLQFTTLMEIIEL